MEMSFVVMCLGVFKVIKLSETVKEIFLLMRIQDVAPRVPTPYNLTCELDLRVDFRILVKGLRSSEVHPLVGSFDPKTLAFGHHLSKTVQT